MVGKMAKRHVEVAYELSSDDSDEEKSDTTADDEESGNENGNGDSAMDMDKASDGEIKSKEIIMEGDADDEDGEADDEDEVESGTQEDTKSGLADVMAKILGKQPRKRKDQSTILLKALTDKQLELKRKAKEKEEALKEGRVKKESDDEEDPAKLRERRIKKKSWEEMNRVPISIIHKDREKKLQRIATRGVVQLFNAVRKQQREIGEKLKEAGGSEHRKDKVMKSLSKGAFLDLLKTTPNVSSDDKPSEIKTEIKEEDLSEDEAKPSWSILRDDFMMGAKMKDWDKEDDDEDEDGSDQGDIESSDDDQS